MKYIKEDLEKYILVDKLSYEAIGKIYQVSGVAIKKAAIKLGITLERRAKFPEGFKPANFNTGIIPNCKRCGKACNNKDSIFCSHKCWGEQTKENSYKDFIENNYKYQGAELEIKTIKPHIIKEQFNCCDICGITESWNNKNLVFILDHIDGNAFNNQRNNLRAVCPNCDSQLNTFKSKNKNSARKERYLSNKKDI